MPESFGLSTETSNSSTRAPPLRTTAPDLHASITASLIVDGHHLPAAVVKTFVRVKLPERIVLISDLSGMAGLPPGRYQTELCELEILPTGKIVMAGQTQLLAAACYPQSDIGSALDLAELGTQSHALLSRRTGASP